MGQLLFRTIGRGGRKLGKRDARCAMMIAAQVMRRRVLFPAICEGVEKSATIHATPVEDVRWDQ